MKILNVNITNKVAVYSQRGGEIVCGNDDYQIKFTFDAEWSGYNSKTARFSWNGQYKDVTFTGDTVTVPALFNTSVLMVGVYAGDLSTTTRARITCVPSALCGTDTAGPGSGETYYNEAKAAAERAEAAAETAAAEAAQTVVDLAAEKLLGGIVQTSGDSETQVMSQKATTDLVKRIVPLSDEIYSKDTCSINAVIKRDGTEANSNDFGATDYIPVNEHSKIKSINPMYSNPNMANVAFYDAKKNYVSSIGADGFVYDFVVDTTPPEGVKYVRLSFYGYDSSQIRITTWFRAVSENDFEEAKDLLREEIDGLKENLDNALDEEDIAQEAGDSETKVMSQKAVVEFVEETVAQSDMFRTYNLFNPDAVKYNKYHTEWGEVNDNSGTWAVIENIPVTGGQTYSIALTTVTDRFFFYDVNGTATRKLLSELTLHDGVRSVVAPDNAVSFSFSFNFGENDINKILVYEGYEAKAYVPYYAVPKEMLPPIETDNLGESVNGLLNEKIDKEFGINLFDPRWLESGSINNVTGADMGQANALRTCFIPIEDGVNYVFTIFDKFVRGGVAYYGSEKNFLGYKDFAYEGDNTTRFSRINTSDYNGAKYVRFRIYDLQNRPLTPEEPYFKYQWEKNTEIGYYVTPNPINGYLEDYIYQSKNDTVFFNNDLTDNTKIISGAIKELYVPDESLKGVLRFNWLDKTEGEIKLSSGSTSSTVTVLPEYGIKVTEQISGVQLVEIKSNLIYKSSAYILIDWDKVPDGTAIKALYERPYILSDKVYNLDNSPTIKEQLENKNRAFYNSALFADTARIGEVDANVLKMHRNHSIPTKGLCISTDVEYYTRQTARTTDEERIKSLIPYLYFNGRKVGTVVLYDEETGEPFIWLKDGSKKVLS